MRDFNLVVSTYRARENDCISELWYLLREMGDERVSATPTGLPGLVLARTSLDPVEVVERMRREAEENPWYFRFILKVVPVQVVVEARVDEIARAALELAERGIGEGESYKIVVRKRLSDLDTREIIGAIAPKLDRRVDLESPDKIIAVEIIGDRAGVSVIRPEHVVSLQRIRRGARRG